MNKVAVIGHSQVPSQISSPTCEIDIYRVPGGKVASFFTDPRFTAIFQQEYKLVILWIGSNDIEVGTDSRVIADKILEVGREIEETCKATVIVVEIERRKYPVETGRITPEDYKRIQRRINKHLLDSKQFLCIHFNDKFFELGQDGVHFEPDAQERVVLKLQANIESHANQ